MSAPNAGKSVSDIAKRASTLLWFIKGLFFPSNVTMTSRERVAQAEEKLAEAEKILTLAREHPELSEISANLQDACNRAEDRMERFKRVNRMV